MIDFLSILILVIVLIVVLVIVFVEILLLALVPLLVVVLSNVNKRSLPGLPNVFKLNLSRAES